MPQLVQFVDFLESANSRTKLDIISYAFVINLYFLCNLMMQELLIYSIIDRMCYSCIICTRFVMKFSIF